MFCRKGLSDTEKKLPWATWCLSNERFSLAQVCVWSSWIVKCAFLAAIQSIPVECSQISRGQSWGSLTVFVVIFRKWSLDKLEPFERNNMASPSPQSSPMPPPQAPSPMGPPQQAPSPSAQGSPMGPPQHHPHSPTQGYQGGPPIPPGGPPMSQPPQQPPPQQQSYPPHPQQMPPNMGPQVC